MLWCRIGHFVTAKNVRDGDESSPAQTAPLSGALTIKMKPIFQSHCQTDVN